MPGKIPQALSLEIVDGNKHERDVPLEIIVDCGERLLFRAPTHYALFLKV